jgi:hypothetical protein
VIEQTALVAGRNQIVREACEMQDLPEPIAVVREVVIPDRGVGRWVDPAEHDFEPGCEHVHGQQTSERGLTSQEQL